MIGDEAQDSEQVKGVDRFAALNRNVRYGVPRGFVLSEDYQDFWPNIILGITLVEVFLPATTFLLVNAISRGGFPATSLVTLLGICFILLLIGMTLGFLFFLLVALLASQLIRLLFRSVQLDCESLSVGVFTGGLSGMTIILPFYWLSHPATRSELLPILLLSTILGQLGALIGAWKTHQARMLRADEQLRLPIFVRFNLKQLLIATTWCAAILSAMKVVGLLESQYLGFFVSWIALQGVAQALLGIFTWLSPAKRTRSST